ALVYVIVVTTARNPPQPQPFPNLTKLAKADREKRSVCISSVFTGNAERVLQKNFGILSDGEFLHRRVARNSQRHGLRDRVCKATALACGHARRLNFEA